MVAVRSTLVKYRKYITVAVLTIIILSSVLAFTNVRSRQRDVIDTLEKADFIVTKFDVTGGTPSTLEAVGELLYNYSEGTIPSGIEIEGFSAEVFNGSEIITEVDVPVGDISKSQYFDFQISIPIDDTIISELISDVLINIMTGEPFVLSFRGEIQYKIGLMHDSIEFSNILQFKLDQPVLELDLRRLDLPEHEEMINGSIAFDLYNPFSIDVSMEGTIDVLVTNINMGTIDLSPRYFKPATNYVVEEVELVVSQEVLFKTYFQAIQEPIELRTSLILGFGELKVNVSPVLDLSSSGLDFDFNISSIDELNINYLNGVIDGVISGYFISRLPVTLNMTRISGQIFSGETSVGAFTWNDTNSILVATDTSVYLSLISFNSSVDKLPYYIDLASNLNFKEVSLSIYVLDTLITYDITI